MTADTYQSASDGIDEKLVRAHNGDATAREELVRENIGLVKFIVRRYLNRGMEYEDLFQYGCLGLLKAVDRFDPSFSVRFSTYAVPVIMGEIQRCIRDDNPIHVSRTIQESARRVEDYVQRYTQDNRRTPSLSEVADALEMEQGDVLLAMNSRNRVRSLDERVGDDADLRLKDVIGMDTMAAVDQKLTLAKLLRDLPEQDRTLILRRYFKSHTQAQIAREMGTSQVQVSRMESRIIKRMRMLAGMQD